MRVGTTYARYQRRMARCQQGSANRAKAKAKVARAHRKVRAARADFLHLTSTRLVRDHDLISLEDLAVKNMVRNRRLARAIADCGWGTFQVMLEYKAARAGRRVIVIGRWFPSSKMCSACGHVLAELSLGTRTWQCPSCGTRHDRDINAAKNILAAGLAVAGGQPPGHACGADVRHPGPPGCSRAVKQEPWPVRTGIPSLKAGSSQQFPDPSTRRSPLPGSRTARRWGSSECAKNCERAAERSSSELPGVRSTWRP